MKSTLIGCPQCSGFQFIEFDYFNDGIANIECDNKHKFTCFVQGTNVEKLLESGVHALANKNTLEACASIYAAYERSIEFAIDVFSHHDGIDLEALEATKKSMSNQSERQLGAFLMLYFRKIGSPYKLSRKVTEERNKFIHKGFIPGIERAHQFCKKVYELIAELIVLLKSRFPNSVDVVRNQLLQDFAKGLPGNHRVVNMSTQFFHIPASNIETNFERAFKLHMDATRSFHETALKIRSGTL
ncbi:hypothetical protein [Pseudoalteromonas maricaloris]|uniref:hypothetical protein n=1 Tax=Pseudoalteromonas maricaloris TaxID=184924 RepID=UPI00057E5330|nr:hypothetical protein [Pseudoalteromonas flavipulchra]KID37277.1 hypothetical protein QT15_08220 [Pseudoalteromonas flavipulchra NCIMB 2033 = ATCC BAA-314]MBD0783095.1 hypothetical protein [Pseudoalteromonas flavipulchra]MBE0374640.1 hypothetical protein [Pseudoalteromonas flavipulchra NCIMB 2033 = ATCC BAA-314]